MTLMKLYLLSFPSVQWMWIDYIVQLPETRLPVSVLPPVAPQSPGCFPPHLSLRWPGLEQDSEQFSGQTDQ